MDEHPVMQSHGSFSHLKLGKLPRKHDARTLRLAHYLDWAKLPVIPTGYDLTTGVKLWPMYGNDKLGDCTCAAAGHLIQSWSAESGREKTPTEAVVERVYWETGTPPAANGIPEGPTDTGRYELDVLNYWHKHGVGTDRIAAYAAIDPLDRRTMRAAIWLFGGVYTGVALPLSARYQSVWRKTSGAGSEPGSWGGHAVPYVAFTQTEFKCITWGGVMRLTAVWSDEYCDEAYAIISPDWLNGGRSPQGLKIDELQADLDTLSS